MIRSHVLDGAKIETQIDDKFAISSDQPAPHGEDSAPSPFDVFLAGISGCAAYFAQRYCRKWKLPHEGISVDLIPSFDDRHALIGVDLRINVPDSFPREHLDGLLKNANACPVKKALENPPQVSLGFA
ncbi:MAG: OsmC family protein [Rhodocyclaceae bacterium]|jgi:uncharacterized OsmC-like protein|nr:OsmC family protein [Rhodocyclaceae bacterium]